MVHSLTLWLRLIGLVGIIAIVRTVNGTNRKTKMKR